jgi:hypothetical protein
LEHEAHDLAHAGIDQVELLAGAERVAALAPVLKAAGVLHHEIASMVDIAARGLRSALDPETLSRHSARIGALDRRLDSARDD